MTNHYESQTDGIRVTVRPRFSLAQSDPAEREFVFSYQIRMENEGDETAQLLFRHWHIHDAGGEDQEVDGEGVIGLQPVLTPGQTHEYQSFCVLTSPAGFMEGYYTFVRPDGTRFRVAIPRFKLEAPLPAPPRDEEDGPELMN
jgi:ApaG protein